MSSGEMCDLPPCDVCHSAASIGVAAMPAVAISMAYCQRCLDANAHPWELLVANTAMIGGYEEAADFWRQMIEDTCRHLGKSRAEFDAEVCAFFEALPKGPNNEPIYS